MTTKEQTGERDDLIGIAAMAGGNVLLVINDTLVKLTAGALPLSEVIFLRAIAAMTLLMGVAWLTSPVIPRPTRILALRALLEGVTSFAYLYALQLIPIGELVGLQQTVPLAILAGAALMLGERIGWRGWLAALVGLAGALLIIKPGSSDASGIAGVGLMLAVLAVVTAVARDLVTRVLPQAWPPAFVAGTSQIAMIVGGLMAAPFDGWSRPPPMLLVQILVAALFLAVANRWLVTAMRSGRIAVVSPFRYAGLLAALASGWLVWGHLPDLLALAGCAIITLSGLFSLWQSRRRTEARAAA